MKALVLVAGGLHLGYLGCYGNDWIDTPSFDRLAAEGVVFDQHYADRPDAAGARRAWRTGCYAFPPLPGESQAGPAPSADLLELLAAQQVPTHLVTDARCCTPTEFRAGWDRIEVVAAGRDGGSNLEKVFDALCRALKRLRTADQWLLWVEVAALLPPWNVPEGALRPEPEEETEDDEAEDAEEEEPLEPLTEPTPGWLDPADDITFRRLQRTYAAAVADLDGWLGGLLEEPDRRGLADDLLLAVTTDRGQALGEHGMVGDHRPWLHEELVHLPLLLRLPGRAEAGRRPAALTQAVDLMPTLLEVFGIPAPLVHGRSLLPLARGCSEPLRAYACTGLQMGDCEEVVLRTPKWAFVLPVAAAAGDPPRGLGLYVKPDDRWEVNNVLQHHLELAEHLEQTLKGFVAATHRPGPLQAPPLRDIEAELPATADEQGDTNPGGTNP